MPSLRKSILLGLCAISSLTQAHVEMTYPYPFRSSKDPSVSNPDYNMLSPLMPDGSDFPCKGYQGDAATTSAKAIWTAGETVNITLEGSATHGGGSCQYALSYDNGQMFKVVQSNIGGCPLATGPLPNTHAYNVTIPTDIPAGTDVLFAWTWFNKIGNREMYMNCAKVQIVSSTPSRRYARTSNKRTRDAISSLPNIFTCNINNGCQTQEGDEVVYPDPGNHVIFGGTAMGQSGRGFIEEGDTSSPSSASPSATMPSAGFPTISGVNATMTYYSPTLTALSTTLPPSLTSSSTSSTSAALSVIPIPGPSGAPGTSSTLVGTAISTSQPTAFGAFTSSMTTMPSASTMSTAAQSSPLGSMPSAAPLTGPCTPGALGCNSPSSFSICVPSTSCSSTSSTCGAWTFMGSVAAGMTCTGDGSIIRQNDGPCTPSGDIFCNGTEMFYMCDQGGLISMGSVAPGTQCVNGQIQ